MCNLSSYILACTSHIYKVPRPPSFSSTKHICSRTSDRTRKPPQNSKKQRKLIFEFFYLPFQGVQALLSRVEERRNHSTACGRYYQKSILVVPVFPHRYQMLEHNIRPIFRRYLCNIPEFLFAVGTSEGVDARHTNHVAKSILQELELPQQALTRSSARLKFS